MTSTPAGRLRLPGTRRTISRAAAETVWDSALCAQVDPELFFPDRGQAAQSRAARAICRRCDVRALCLATFGPLINHGVVGGTTDAMAATTKELPRDRNPAEPPAPAGVDATSTVRAVRGSPPDRSGDLPAGTRPRRRVALRPARPGFLAPVRQRGLPVIYLLHFDAPYRHARHYLGTAAAGHLEARLAAHAAGRGARLTQVVAAAGIGWQLARTWPGGRDRERQLKRQGGASRRCPMCGVHPRQPAAPTSPTSIGDDSP